MAANQNSFSGSFEMVQKQASQEWPLVAAGSTDQRNTLILVQRWSVVMKQRRRIYYSAAQRSEIWDRWQAGEPMSSIGRRFDRESSSVFSVISPTGGIRPPDRHRAKQALSLSEREEISRWLSMRCSLRSIALHLGRPASTVSREVQRNGGSDRYRAARSDQAAWDRARRPKRRHRRLASRSPRRPKCARRNAPFPYSRRSLEPIPEISLSGCS
jgi:DNA-binding CsgD family transcriptional regulator